MGSRSQDAMDPARRRLLRGAAAAPLLLAAGAGRGASPLDLTASERPPGPGAVDPTALARDEAHWARIGRFYARTEGVTNLEHGYWGRMAEPVLGRYQEALARVNRENSWYARRLYGADYEYARERVARLIGADPEEVALTRNATEAVHNVVRQYRELSPGDAVLLADVDYPAFKRLMESLGASHGVEVVTLELPPRADQDELFARYEAVFEAHPNLKLALVTHASNQHGLVLPVARIAELCRERGVHLVCDAAQSLGLLDFRVDDLGVDWAGFNLHKWIGAPLGLGALYMRRGTLGPVAPYPGEQDPAVPDVQRRIHTGTWDFAAAITIPAAVDFHEAVGGAAKEARLRHLRSLWTEPLAELDGLEILGGRDEASWTGMAALRLRGRTSADDVRALQARLEQEFGIFTVARFGLASGSCVRVTPQVYTTAAEIGQLVGALRTIAA
ncbi:MAG: aminotransferase class V-fold PLP-dependent enzyme [Pseudomonadales bacterium]|jgi:selenocysteine lyase/cysteine desulfurase|nr:aminotransferase class V-fold PLP-dependent enzyme [Pseudomonadales bacterium]